MHMGPDRDGPRPDLRRQARREAERRRRRERRLLGGSLVVLAFIGLVLLTPIGSTEKPGQRAGEKADERPPTALERAIANRERAEQALDNVLGYTEFLRFGKPNKRQVALTFDDGPGPYTNQVLQILRRHGAPATFFISGVMVDEFPGIVERAQRQGHAIGNHGADHMRMGELPPEVQAQQIDSVTAALTSHGVEPDRLFRPPYGAFNADTVDLLAARRMLMVLWSIDTGDYENPGTDVIIQRALEGVGPGDVILMHDAGGDRTQTVAALPVILRELRKRNLQPVTVPELLINNPPPRNQDLGLAEAVAPPGAGLAG